VTTTNDHNELERLDGILYISGAFLVTDSDYTHAETLTSSTTSITLGSPVTGTYVTARALGRTEWVCITEKILGAGKYITGVQVVTDNYTLPANTGFIVVTGQASADGITAVQDDYFRPRTADLTVTGNATLILLR
jgi:archaellum component FlaF (FlaF/FlaG flagellin family)